MMMMVTTGCASVSVNSSAQDTVGTALPTIYPFLLDPAVYPDYTRRPNKVPDWTTFDNRPQFVASRSMPSKSWAEETPGRVFRPNLWWIQRFNLTYYLDVMKERDYYLFNVGGYGPGSPINGGSFGQLKVSDTVMGMIEERLGDRFLGFDLGEQDGRYNYTYEKMQCPAPTTPIEQYLFAQRYMQQICDDLGNSISQLSVLWYWHYPIKDGTVVLAGAETQNKVTNSQVQYMFLRGAGKQYGVHWFGDISVFDTWGYKRYSEKGYEEDNVHDNPPGPTRGNSLSLMKRLLYTHYLYNSVILGFEGSLYTYPNEKEITPIGVIQREAARFLDSYPQPGVMHTPVAILLDFFSGWMPARHWRGSYVVWNHIPYGSGDYLTHSVISMLYPGYEDSGFYQDERGALVNTPYGDLADAILSDVSANLMMQYGLIVAAGNLISADTELRDKITKYVSNGGQFVVTAENARRLWPEWRIGETVYNVPSGASIYWTQTGELTTEEHAFELYSVELPSAARVIARYDSLPAIAEMPIGHGSVTLILSPFGLNRDKLAYEDPGNPYWNPDKPLGKPFVLLNHVESILDKKLAAQRLFSVGDDLGYIVNRKGPGEYTIGIYNNSLTSKPFRIESYIGDILEIRELDLGQSVKDEIGYWPHGYEGNDGGLSDDAHISGGDIRLFSVKVDEKNVLVLPKIDPEPRPNGRMVAVDDIAYLKDKILRWPTFFEHFDGVKVDWTRLVSMDKSQLARDSQWLNNQKLRLVVDFRSGFDSGVLSLRTDMDAESDSDYTFSVIADAMDKMAVLDHARDIVISVESASGAADPQQIAGRLGQLCSIARQYGVTVHVDLAGQTDLIGSGLSDLLESNSNLRIALDTAGYSDGDQLVSGLTASAGHLGVIFITPEPSDGAVDYSQIPRTDAIQILNANYDSWDVLYGDLKVVWKGDTSQGLQGTLRSPAEDIDRVASPGNWNHYLAFHGITDLRAAINQHSEFYDYFGGVKVDSSYIASRDVRQCAIEGEWLESKGIGLIVDFTREINHFPDITLMNLVKDKYERSVAIENDVFYKMSIMGARIAVIQTHMRPEGGATESEAYKALIDGIKDFCQRASDYGITVCIQHNRFRDWGDPYDVRKIVDTVGQPNLQMAINTNHDGNLPSLRLVTGDRLGLIILGAPGSPTADVHRAIHKSKIGVKSLLSLDVIQVLDGEYSDFSEVLEDCKYMGWSI